MRFGPSGADRLLAAPGRSQSPPTPTPGEAHAGWGRSRRTAMRQTGKRRARREDGGAKPPAPRTNIYDDVTHRIVAELEAGRFPWVQPWGRTGLAATGLQIGRASCRERVCQSVSIVCVGVTLKKKQR